MKFDVRFYSMSILFIDLDLENCFPLSLGRAFQDVEHCRLLVDDVFALLTAVLRIE